MTHKKHPPCPDCGKALYKTPSVGGRKPKPSDPYAFCRNSLCGKPDGDFKIKAKPIAPKALKMPPKRRTRTRRVKAAGDIRKLPRSQDAITKKSDPKPAAKPEEPWVVVKARIRIRKAMSTGDQLSKSVIGLTIAILAQELGGHEIANKIIDDYKLTQTFGIQKHK